MTIVRPFKYFFGFRIEGLAAAVWGLGFSRWKMQVGLQSL